MMISRFSSLNDILEIFDGYNISYDLDTLNNELIIDFEQGFLRIVSEPNGKFSIQPMFLAEGMEDDYYAPELLTKEVLQDYMNTYFLKDYRDNSVDDLLKD